VAPLAQFFRQGKIHVFLFHALFTGLWHISAVFSDFGILIAVGQSEIL